MKTRYNKSKIMELAHHRRKEYGCTLSQALKMAWAEARRSEFYLIIVKPKANTSFEFDMSGAANYYASKQSGAYTGD